MRALAPPNVELIKRLEVQAQQDPAGYRRSVGLLSAAGNLALTLILLLPIALPVIVVLMAVRNPVIDTVAVLSLLLFLWILRPNHDETGHLLTRAAAPGLYAALDDLRAKLNVGHDLRIVLVNEFNAGALEMPGLLGGLGTQRTMYLGVPLLAALTREELLGVIGHELGHFSRRHGPLGHRIYRARQGWLAYAESVDKNDSAFDKGAAAFAHLFIPYFNSFSFVYGRQCEYEADADAAGAVGAATMVEALVRSQVVGALWFDDFHLELARLQRASATPPDDLLERFIRYAAGFDPAELERRVQKELDLQSDWLDTHPCLAERAAALQAAVRLAPSAAACAGESLLGDEWRAVARDFNRKWQHELRAQWALEHARQHYLGGLLELPPGSPALLSWPVEQRLARASLLASHEPGQAIAELQALLVDHPQDVGASYALGELTLKSAPQAAIALLEFAAKQDQGFRVPAYALLEGHFRKHGDAQSAYNYARRLELAHKRRSLARSLFRREISLGQFLASDLPPGSAPLLQAARQADPWVAGG